METILDLLAVLESQHCQILARLDQIEEKLGKPPKPQKIFWSVEELAAAIKRAPFTVREWCRRGQIEAEKDEYHRRWRIPNSEASRLIAGG